MDLGSGEGFRHSAACLRRCGKLLELLGRDARDIGLSLQFDTRDREAALDLLQMDMRGGMNARRRMARLSQLRRKRHGEAACMGRPNQFLWVGSCAVGGARAPVIRAFKGPAAKFDLSFSFEQVSIPYGFGGSSGHRCHLPCVESSTLCKVRGAVSGRSSSRIPALAFRLTGLR